MFPRDPDFREKAGRVLDLYERRWEGKRLHPGDYVISADEKTQLQALLRRHRLVAPAPGRPGLVEHEYRRNGTLAYLAAMDVHDPRRGLFGRCEAKISNDAFDALVDEVMTAEPYASARRVFWVVDNGTIHRGQKAIDRLQDRWPNLVLVHLPLHASWLNPIEIYFSIVARKALTPVHFSVTDELAERVIGFQADYRTTARRLTGRSPAATSTPSSTDSISAADSRRPPERTCGAGTRRGPDGSRVARARSRPRATRHPHGGVAAHSAT